MSAGRIVKTGGRELAQELERTGYELYEEKKAAKPAEVAAR